jgi:tetratricopeptide (TPR) repeat protein
VFKLNPENNFEELLIKLKEAEETIESAIWQAGKDSDYEKELSNYKQVKSFLASLGELPHNIEKERNRILSYCLMRMDNALAELGDEEKAVDRAEEALKLAEKSEDVVQIARASLAYGTRLLNNGEITEAEMQFGRVIRMSEDYPDNRDIQQVFAWSLIVRGHILNGKSLYNQALKLLEEAEEICFSIDNYAGIGQANQVKSLVYRNLGDSGNAEKCLKKAQEYRDKSKAEQK